jgi:hypothetical protein
MTAPIQPLLLSVKQVAARMKGQVGKVSDFRAPRRSWRGIPVCGSVRQADHRHRAIKAIERHGRTRPPAWFSHKF